MVFKSSISNTRKFFQKTIDNFKSLFSNKDTYHKLPKTTNNTSLNNHHHNDTNPDIIITSSSPSIHKQFQPKPRDYINKNRANLTIQPRRRRRDKDKTIFSKPKVEFVRRKLEEMEKKMMNDDMIINDEEHISDVREFLHCYSLLRCEAYIDVVEEFFMEVYSDFFTTQHRREAVGSMHLMASSTGRL